MSGAGGRATGPGRRGSSRAATGESPVLHGVTLEIRAGEILAILGKNGMGKTTLLKTMMGLLPARHRPSGGARRGRDRWPPYRITRLGVSYVPQEKSIFQDLSVEENLRLALGRRRLRRAARDGGASGSLPEGAAAAAGGDALGRRAKDAPHRPGASHPAAPAPGGRDQRGTPAGGDRAARGGPGGRAASARAAVVLVEQNVGFALALADRYAVLKIGTVVETGRAAEAGARERIERHLVI